MKAETGLVRKLVCVFDLHPDIHFDIALNKNCSVIYLTRSKEAHTKVLTMKLHELPVFSVILSDTAQLLQFHCMNRSQI